MKKNMQTVAMGKNQKWDDDFKWTLPLELPYKIIACGNYFFPIKCAHHTIDSYITTEKERIWRTFAVHRLFRMIWIERSPLRNSNRRSRRKYDCSPTPTDTFPTWIMCTRLFPMRVQHPCSLPFFHPLTNHKPVQSAYFPLCEYAQTPLCNCTPFKLSYK